jgi:type IV pilus assembly protein PilX
MYSISGKPVSSLPIRQQGIVMVVSLLFLLILTIIGVTAMNSSTLEERMSGNLRDRNLAFQAAESALRAGEIALRATLVNPPTAAYGCTDKYVCPLLTSDLSSGASAWNGDRAVEVTGTTLAGVASSPKYIIEVITPVPQVKAGYLLAPGSSLTAANAECYYRITARGIGGAASTTAVLQSTFRHDAIPVNDQGVCHG